MKTCVVSVLFSLLFASQSFAADITNEEKLFLQRLVFAEAGSEPEDGQIAVAACILNRVKSPQYPNSIKEVAFQKWQFSSVQDGTIWIGAKEVTQEMVPETTIRAVERALMGQDPTEQLLLEEAQRKGLDIYEYVVGGSLYFYNPDICSEKALADRANIQVQIRIGRHLFYKTWN